MERDILISSKQGCLVEKGMCGCLGSMSYDGPAGKLATA